MIDVNKLDKSLNANVDTFVKELQERQDGQRKMLETDSYIKWLESFVKRYPNFSDATWLYAKQEISDKDNENVKLLCEFFSAIDDFADKNYIPCIQCKNSSSYYIKYNEKIYEIGLIVGQGAICFCNTLDIDANNPVMLFEEFSNPDDMEIRKRLIEKKLNSIDTVLMQLNSSALNIPIGAIEARVKKVLRELKKNQ